jgi:histidine triad (HIT) family protein
VIPKGPYLDLADFAANAPAAEQSGFLAAVAEAVRLLGLEEGGFRTVSNSGAHAHQEVPHFHLHILGGRPLGPLLAPTGA